MYYEERFYEGYWQYRTEPNGKWKDFTIIHYNTKIQQLENTVNESKNKKESKDAVPVDNDLWDYFGLSYASFLVLPRVLLHEMPLEWQNKLAGLLWEYYDVFPNLPDIGSRVQITQNGKMIKTPEWIVNYRHPIQSEIDKFKKQSSAAKTMDNEEE